MSSTGKTGHIDKWKNFFLPSNTLSQITVDLRKEKRFF
jgi:hypothetical protein